MLGQFTGEYRMRSTDQKALSREGVAPTITEADASYSVRIGPLGIERTSGIKGAGEKLRFFRCSRGAAALASLLLTSITLGSLGCVAEEMRADRPARGPGQLVGNGETVSSGTFAGGGEVTPKPAMRPVPDPMKALVCDAACQDYCRQLNLEHPVHRAICSQTWGMGLSLQPEDRSQACRRVYADMLGRYPRIDEMKSCQQADWPKLVTKLLASEDFVRTQQRRFADVFLYNNRAVNLERIYDLDELVAKTHRGKVAWDHFAAVVSAHPAFVRRYDSGPDRVDALFRIFVGRPPSDPERSDLSRSYAVWENGYIDHAYLGRVPDAVIRFPCVGKDGRVDPKKAGACTSTLFGKHEVIIERDRRAARKDDEPEGAMWSGYLRSEEWEQLQVPGRIVASLPTFWERAVDDVLSVYFGDRNNGGPYYDVATQLPQLRVELAKYLLAYKGDIRALHFAVATSQLYRQNARADASTPWPWTYGPLKQIDAEAWIDSLVDGFRGSKSGTARANEDSLGRCDRRLAFPQDLIGEKSNGWTRALVGHSEWRLNEKGAIDRQYANFARTLGGCPTRESGPSFRAVSIVNTAVQESLVELLCSGQGSKKRISWPKSRLWPESLKKGGAMDAQKAEALLRHQSEIFLGRAPEAKELNHVQTALVNCQSQDCDVEIFARGLCFSILSSAELLFY